MSDVANRDDPLWIAIFNAIPSTTTDGRLLLASRRMQMADTAWLIADASKVRLP